MRNQKPLPLPKIETTVHGAARVAIVRLAIAATADCEAFHSAEEQMEFFEILQAWANANIENIRGITETWRTAGVHTGAVDSGMNGSGMKG
jgi:hypothetical protein